MRTKSYIQEVVSAIKFSVTEIIVNVIKLVLAVAICVDATTVWTRPLFSKKIKLNKFFKRREEKNIKLLLEKSKRMSPKIRT